MKKITIIEEGVLNNHAMLRIKGRQLSAPTRHQTCVSSKESYYYCGDLRTKACYIQYCTCSADNAGNAFFTCAMQNVSCGHSSSYNFIDHQDLR